MVQPYESENGWRPRHAGEDLLNWVRIPGAEHVSLRFMKGWPTTVLRAFAADYHANVEWLRDGDSAAFTPTNSVATSNHLNGTACDLNWSGADQRTFRLGISEAAAYPGHKAQAVRDLLSWYEGMVFCGGAWSIRDWMHFQMGGNTWNNPRTQNFIDRKIRADGFSTYKRGGTTMPPPPPIEGAQVLAQVMGYTVGIERYRELLPGFRDAVLRAQAATPKRINMFTAQLGHESVGLKYMKEIWGPTQQQLTYQGRMGNNNPGDGERYMGRGPIQITGKDNYRSLSQWAHSQGFVPTPTFFVDQPHQLESPQYGFLGAVWYWTVARPKINEQCDWDDLEASLRAVTKAINGGLTGLDDRRNRLNRARSMDLAPIMRDAGPTPPPPVGEDDFLSALSEEQQRDVWQAARNQLAQRKSRSPFREPGEGTVGDSDDQIWDMDSSIHILVVFLLAMCGHPGQLALLNRVATVGDPDRQKDAELAQAVLAEVAESAALKNGILAALGRVADTAGSVATTYSRAEPVEVLPARVEYVEPVQSMNTPDALLDTMDRLKKFDESYREKFEELSKKGK